MGDGVTGKEQKQKDKRTKNETKPKQNKTQTKQKQNKKKQNKTKGTKQEEGKKEQKQEQGSVLLVSILKWQPGIEVCMDLNYTSAGLEHER